MTSYVTGGQPLEWKYMSFQHLSTIKVNPVAKIMQTAYLCVIFHVKHKKITISYGFNLISNSCQNQRWRPLLLLK